MTPFTYIAGRIDSFVLPVVSRNALPILKREYDCTTAHQILWRAWQGFGSIARLIPPRRPPGTRVMLSFAAASAALHRALVDGGKPDRHATDLVAEIASRGYRELSRTPWWLARLITFDSVARLSTAAWLSRWFGLTPAATVRRSASPVDGSLSMHATRCPAVELYRELGIGHLSRPLVCDLEHAAAEAWQAEIVHTASLVEGDARCHFQMRSIAPQHGGRDAEQPLY